MTICSPLCRSKPIGTPPQSNLHESEKQRWKRGHCEAFGTVRTSSLMHHHTVAGSVESAAHNKVARMNGRLAKPRQLEPDTT
jgi:hypothetical protein